MEQNIEPTKQTLSNFENIVKFTEEIKESGTELVEVLKELSEKFMEIYDLELAEEMTEIYEEIVGLNKIAGLELMNSVLNDVIVGTSREPRVEKHVLEKRTFRTFCNILFKECRRI